MVRKTAAVIAFGMMISLLSGCWDYREINELPIVVGIAIDMTEDDKFLVTAEMVDVKEGGKETNITSRIIDTKGDTVFDALRNAIRFELGRLYLGHMEVVILSRSVLEKRLLEVLDFLIRYSETRMNIWLMVSQEETAAELLRLRSVTTEIRTFEISQMIEEQKDLSKSFEITVNEFMNILQCPGFTPVLPCLTLLTSGGIKTQALHGTAIVKNGKFSGYLNEDETMYFCFITDRIKGGVLNIGSEPGKHMNDTSLEILESKTTVKPTLANGKISFEIEIYANLSLSEHGAGKHERSAGMQMHRKQAEELISQKASELIKRMQKEYGADIFGFGNKVHIEYPDYWRKIENEWESYFSEIQFTIKPTVQITESGMLYESITVEE